MKKLFSIAIVAVSFLSLNQKSLAQIQKSGGTEMAADHQDPDGYYTCPMHPHVHEHKAGKCPICGMPLVKKFSDGQKKKIESHKGSKIPVTTEQLKLVGIGKYTVTKKDMTFVLPVSGRMLSSREVVFQIFESDLSLVKSGLEFKGALAVLPDQELTGQIRSIDYLVDPSSRTIRVVGSLAQNPKQFVIEGSFHGEILNIEKDQIAVPEQAVLHTGEENLVYLFTSENKLLPAAVVLGKKSSKEYQILSGLNEGDVISTGPNFLIDSEAKIRGDR